MFRILPHIYFLTLILICILTTVAVLLNKNGVLENIAYLGNILVVAVVTVGISTSAITLGTGFWAPRVVYPLGAMLGVLLFYYAFAVREWNISYKKLFKGLCVSAVIICLAAQLLSFYNIILDKHSLSELDAYRCKMVAERISEYEQENQVTISQVGIYSKHNYSQYNLWQSGDLITSSFSTSWSDVAALEYYSNRSFVRIECPDEIQELFNSQQWTTYSDSQIIFNGNTVYLCVY